MELKQIINRVSLIAVMNVTLMVEVSLIFMVVILISCGQSTSPKNNGEDWGEKGTISFVDVEGGCWEIVTDSGEDYEPINLDEEFKVDGLRVRFEYKIEKEMGSICMISNKIISITRIETL